MIARIWWGRTQSEDSDAYLEYLEESGVAALKETPGNRGVMVLRRLDGDEAEFGVVSFWDSLVVQAAIEAGCERLYSEDLNAGQKFGSVTIVNPFERS